MILRLDQKALQCGRSVILRLEVGWDIFKNALANFFKNGDLNQAAAIALYALLSIIPLFILSVLAASRFLGSNLDIQSRITGIIKSFHPYFSGDLLAQLGQVQDKGHILGWIGISSLIWFSSMIFGAMETALNITFRSETRRNVLLSKLFAFSMIPLGWVVGITSVLLTYVTTLLTSQVSFVEGHILDIHMLTRFILQYVVPFLGSVLFSTIIFVVIPSKRIRLRTAVAGSCLFASLVELVKHAFTWYVANHTRYNAIFGSLETVVILVIWVYYMALIFLFCAEVMSSYERRDLLLIEHMLLRRSSRSGGQRLFRKFGRFFPSGAPVCHEGGEGQEMYFILAGSVRLTNAGSSGKILAELGPGDHFGEMAALTNTPRTATAVAASDCEIAVIDGRLFQRLLRESDDLSIDMLKTLSERLRRTNVALEDLSGSWLRLGVLLRLLLAKPEGEDPCQDLATSTGGDPKEVRHSLEVLSDQGILEYDGRAILAFHEDRAWQLVRDLTDRRMAETVLAG